MIIGISGSICSGKDTLAQMLVGKYGFKSYSLVEILRDEYDRSGESIDTRKNLREFANRRRQRHGAQYLVSAAHSMAQADGLTSDDNILIVGLYCKGEVDYLLDHLGGTLIGVQCNQGVEMRYERYLSRSETSLSPLTFEKFVEWDAFENGGQNDGETNVCHALARASHVLDNDFEPESLLKQLDAIAPAFNLSVCNPDFVCENLSVVDESYVENLRLQRNYEVFSYLKDHFSMKSMSSETRVLAPLENPARCVREIGNQFGQLLVPVFLEPDVEVAWSDFEKIDFSTTDEEMVLLTNRAEFGVLHEEIQNYLGSKSREIAFEVKKNIEEIKFHDRNQFQPGAKRDLKSIRESGIEIRILPEYFETLRDLQMTHASSPMPLLELLKNERMLEMNFINRSKVSTIIHDAMDHVWLYSLLHDRGLLAKYSQLFESIGNPDKFDIFKREGEIVASIGYGVRYWANTTPGFRPRHSVEQIASVLDECFENRELEDRHFDAYRHVRMLAKSPTLRESQSLAFVFSNYLVELDEQRRKHGTIKFRNKDMEILGELDSWSPDFLCYFIETHRLLLDSKSKHRDSLLRAHIILEQHLCSEDARREGNLLRIDADDLDKVDFSHVTLPADRVLWMSRNYGFTAIRDRVFAA